MSESISMQIKDFFTDSFRRKLYISQIQQKKCLTWRFFFIITFVEKKKKMLRRTDHLT